MPSPREIAKSTNEASKFDNTVESAYDPVAGAPSGAGFSQGKERDYAANPVNPSDPAAPAKNLKR